MCFPQLGIVASLAGTALQGFSTLADVRYQTAAAKHQARQATLAAQRKAQQLEREGTQRLGAQRAALAGSGNLSALEFLADGATALGEEIAWTHYGAAVARAEARAAAARARQQAALGLLGAGTQLLTSFGGGDASKAAGDSVKTGPRIVGAYGQLARSGSALRLTDRSGRLIGGV